MPSPQFRAVEILTGLCSLSVLLVSALFFLAGCSRAVQPVSIPSLSPIPVVTAGGTNSSLAELLGRPLQLPKLNPGAQCPRAAGKQVAPAYGLALGSDPVYAAGFGAEGILYFEQPVQKGSQFYGSAWSGNKVLWIVAPAYRGPVLIRGGRLDGPEGLRFNAGIDPPSQLWLDAVPDYASSDWRNEPSFTRIQVPGCYAYQVDGQGFSETIVFEARLGQ